MLNIPQYYESHFPSMFLAVFGALPKHKFLNWRGKWVTRRILCRSRQSRRTRRLSSFNYNYAHQRKRNQAWVKYLANEMSEGRFMQTAEIHIMYCNGDPVLVNGQHTCAAIVEYGKPVRLTVRKTSTREHGQVAMMYAFGHDNGRKRTFTDGLGAYNIGEELGLGSHQVQRMASALKFIRSGFGTDRRYANPSIVEVLDNMPDWVSFGRMFWNNTSAPAGELQRIRKGADKMAVLSIVLVTYRYQRSHANDFWTGILSPGIMDTDPR